MSNEAILIRLGMALVCGMLIGIERKIMYQDAGMRTYGLISFAAALFMIVAVETGFVLHDPQVLRVVAQVVAGIGFLGAALIYFSPHNNTRVGLTSAAAVWAVAGIGMASGLGFQNIALISTAVVLVVLNIGYHIEHYILKLFHIREKGSEKKE